MEGFVAMMPEETATPGVSIPLDLVSALSPFREQAGLSIRVERLPFKARLSKGRNNGDNSWSLTLNDLDDLTYLPPEGLNTPHNLTIRVIRVDSDSASTLMRFDVPIASDGLPLRVPGDAATIPPDVANQGGSARPDTSVTAAVQKLTEAPSGVAPVTAAASTPSAVANQGDSTIPASDVTKPSPNLAEHSGEADRVNGVSTAAATSPAAAPAELLNGHAHPPRQQAAAGDAGLAQELERRLSEARASWEAEHRERATAAVEEAARKAESDIRAQLDQTNEARLAQELERRLAETRASWEAELQGRVAAAVQKAESESRAKLDQTTEVRLALELERRLTEARASWEAELQGRVAVAVEEAAREANSDTRAQLDQTNEARLAQELERRLAEARASWEAEHQSRVAAAVENAVRTTESDARAQLNQTNEARLTQEVERRLAEARTSWEAELQGRVAVAVEDAVRRTESDTRARLDQANEARLAQELERRLAEARVSWEAELHGRVAAAAEDAVRKAESESRMRLEQAQQEWQDVSARELAEMSARYTQAEAALAELRSQPPQGQDAENAARGLREELAAAQALIRTRESELAETRYAIERAGAEISARAREAEASVERNRAAWNAERERLMAQSEENAQQRVKQALERWQHETQAMLSKAQQEWTDAEVTRLAAAEAKWRENIGFAKSRAPITKLAKRGRRVRFAGRLKRVIAVAACLAVAVMFYPRIEPMVAEKWWPKIVAYQGKIEPSLRKATADVKGWLSEMAKQGEARRKQAK